MIQPDPNSESPDRTAERVSTPKAKRYAAAAALVTGGVVAGAMFSPIGLAGATSSATADETEGTAVSDSTDEGSTDEGSTDEGRDGRRGNRLHRRAHRLDNLADIVGIDMSDLRAALADGQTVAEIAADNGVGEDELVDALVAAVSERLDQAVENERIDADEAAEKLESATERIEEFINSVPGEKLGELRANVRLGLRESVDEVAATLGLSSEDLMSALHDGQSLAEVAADQGVDEAELVEVLVAAATERIETAVEEGNLDADRAAELTENLPDRTADLIDRSIGDRGEGHRHGHRHGHHGDAEVDAES